MEDYVSGGSCVVVNLLARFLNEWNVVVFVNASHDDRNLVKSLDHDRIRIVRYPRKTLAEMGGVPVRLAQQGHNLLAFGMRCFNLALRYPHIVFSAFYFRRLFKRYAVDFVISSNGGYPGGEMCRSAVLGSALRHTGALMIVHNMPTQPPALLRPMEKALDGLIGRFSDVIGVSRRVADALDQERFLGKRAAVIENAVEKPSAPRVERSHFFVTDILCIGSISPVKDQIKAVTVYRMLVRRLRETRSDLPTPTLNFIGPVADEVYARELGQFVSDGKIESEQINLIGYSDPQTYLARPGQLLLITSNREGLPLVLLEAMSHGVPTVATNAGGIGEVIAHGENGELREIDDIDGLVDSLWRFVVNPDAYTSAGAACLKIFDERYSIESWIRKYRDRIDAIRSAPAAFQK